MSVEPHPASLELGVIGNCSISALIDGMARIVWSCLPRVDGDPVFHALLGSGTPQETGVFAFDMADFSHAEQSYVGNTAILRTRLYDTKGQCLDVVDFAPRFHHRERIFRPLMIVRRLTPVRGAPRITVRLKPRFAYGAEAPVLTHGSNHIRYVGSTHTMRLTTNAPVDYILNETPFLIEAPTSFLLGPDETPTGGVEETARDFEDRTADYWREWSKRLALPLEWQEAVIRAAITLKLCVFEKTGAIVAALTTSVPEAPHTERNWDYRYCWLRDAFFVIRALNSLSDLATMEHYLRWLNNVVSMADNDHLQPVYGVGLERTLTERMVPSLPGYRGMGPVRVGNQAYEHHQYDVYGNVILGASQAFYDHRLTRRAGLEDFLRLERVGEQAVLLYDKPDAGMWELRTRARVHTSSSLMCWAACDRLAKIARLLGRTEREVYWRGHADTIRTRILTEAWNPKRDAFVESFGGEHLDASVLLMAEVGFLPGDDPRFLSTLRVLEDTLCDGPHMRRYEAPDDFGAPETAFNICAFWRIDALARSGQKAKAREIFEAMLASRNRLGLLSEDVHATTGELWGNFPQTYSMVGIINGATRLSAPWESLI